MIDTVKYARDNAVPYLGLCLGMQVMVIEVARELLGKRLANSTEFDPDTPDPVIDLMREQEGVKDLGGTMRLGAWECDLAEGSVAARCYGKPRISERHRHRYEVNPDYVQRLENAGLVVSGLNPRRGLVEMIEISDHPFFVATQAHPEFKSRPLEPHPLFVAFIRAAVQQRAKVGGASTA